MSFVYVDCRFINIYISSKLEIVYIFLKKDFYFLWFYGVNVVFEINWFSCFYGLLFVEWIFFMFFIVGVVGVFNFVCDLVLMGGMLRLVVEDE